MRQLAVFLLLGLPLAAQAQQPPIIDRSLFFGEVKIAGAQISPDGKFLSFLAPYKGTRNIFVKGVTEPFSAARPISAEASRPIRGYFWSRDSKYLLYAQDNGGDENFNVYAIDPTLPSDPKTGVPPTRALTSYKGVRTEIIDVPRSKPGIIFIGLNDRNPQYHDLYQLDLATGEKKLIRQNNDQIAGWDFDNAGNLRMAERTTKAGDTEILEVDGEKFIPVYTCTVMEQCGVQGFDAANKLSYMITNKGALDLAELDTIDPASGAAVKVESDPLHQVDLSGVEASAIDQHIFFTTYTGDKERRYFRDKAFESQYKWLETKLHGKEINFGARSADENIWIVNASAPAEPGETYLWNRKAKTLDLQYRSREEMLRTSLAETVPFHYKSSDGLDIPAYLTLPKGLPAKNLPLIVFPHGGPWARDDFGYSTFPQFLANRGYAVLQPNFRGSTGFGKRFLNAGNGQWGRLMQDDITWGVKALIANGTADPKRIGISGGSYGGYATLAGVAFTPDLYAAAVAIVAPSNLLTLLDAIPPYWEAGRRQMYTRMADPATAEGKALLVAESPLTRATSIVTPLMVVQGKNDPRVNIRESDQIVSAVRDNGKPIVYLVAPDEGHGFVRPINNLAMVTAMEQFFATYLGGRTQPDVPSEVASKLKEITIDPTTVTATIKMKGSGAN